MAPPDSLQPDAPDQRLLPDEARFASPRCTHCGYDVSTLIKPSDEPFPCPECGQQVRERAWREVVVATRPDAMLRLAVVSAASAAGLIVVCLLVGALVAALFNTPEAVAGLGSVGFLTGLGVCVVPPLVRASCLRARVPGALPVRARIRTSLIWGMAGGLIVYAALVMCTCIVWMIIAKGVGS